MPSGPARGFPSGKLFWKTLGLFALAGLAAPLVVAGLTLIEATARGRPIQPESLWVVPLMNLVYGAPFAVVSAVLLAFPLYLCCRRLGIASPAVVVVAASLWGASLLVLVLDQKVEVLPMGALAGAIVGGGLAWALRRVEPQE